ncbi:Protein of unknown function [Pyronema omphalodes CBS 100304]|uniref:Uncharacterized protein n=1 Tax=Pyronema omphalodes (strain CBS 100304) TaxID=1076935 RepID=U4LRL9_PYROM|nr:Protein of unknown function [Pyronema omphalodes CBS 100304]
MSPHQWPLPVELGLDANDPFYNLYTVLYDSYQASSTATTALRNDIHILRCANSEFLAKLENQESHIKLLEQFTKTQRSVEQERDDALDELRRTNLAKKEIQEQLVNFAKRNVILLNEITQKNKENHHLVIKFENAKDYALEELEELRKEVEDAKNLAMEKQDELENLRRTLSTALFRRNQSSTNNSDTGSILSSSTIGRELAYPADDNTEDDFDNESTLVASTLRSRQTSSTLSRKMSQDTIRTPTASVYSAVTSPSNGTQSSIPKDLHPLRRRGSMSVFSLSLNRNEPTPAVNTPDENDGIAKNKPATCQRFAKKSHNSLKFWRRNKEEGGS